MNRQDADFDDDSLHEWLADIAADCRCCPECASRPCEGVQQGASCDRMCSCVDDADSQGDEDDDIDDSWWPSEEEAS